MSFPEISEPSKNHSTSGVGITYSKVEPPEVMTSIVMVDFTVSNNAADTCTIVSGEVSSTATEYTIADLDPLTVLSSDDDDDPVMSLSEVIEVKESSLEMDVPVDLEEKKVNVRVVSAVGNKVPSLKGTTRTHIIPTVL